MDNVLVFSSLIFITLRALVFFGLCWDTVEMHVSLASDKLNEIQQLAHSLLWTQLVIVCQVMFFLGKTNFCVNGHSKL